jgi:hypothetical protein
LGCGGIESALQLGRRRLGEVVLYFIIDVPIDGRAVQEGASAARQLAPERHRSTFRIE